jgi:DNA invertase Pin-like site-specific DNA recombinase
MANVAYIRVSTVDQNEDRQLENLKQYQIDRIFSEKVSAKDMKRPQLQEMLRYVREGDTVYINDFSRLARSTMDLLSIVEQLQSKNVQLISIKENIDTSTPTGKLMLQMIAAINEFERANLLERQREGIKCAKERGAYKGRKKIEVSEQEFSELYQLWTLHKISKSEMAKRLNVSRTVIDRLIEEKLCYNSTI